jgi:hypothetical protein
MSKMSSQKNELVQLSESQMHPNLADPADFKVMNLADAAKMTVPACYNLDPAEYDAVCDESYELNGAKRTSGIKAHPKRK